MANQEHLDILRQGIEIWNQWRQEHQEVQPDLRSINFNFIGTFKADTGLSGADLSGTDLSWSSFICTNLRGVNLSNATLFRSTLSGANLTGANLTKANLKDTDFRIAELRDVSGLRLWTDLSNANLSDADLSDANLSDADLGDANFTRANLNGTNLSGAILSGINFSGANLKSAYLIGANLSDANLHKATVGGTTFGNVNLSGVRGLETVEHVDPSTIGIDTITRSQGKIPDIFLRNAGVPSPIIDMIPSLVGSLKPIDFYSCFISYSSKDQDFANRLYADLQAARVRCWFAPHDLKMGDRYRDRIEESIRVYDKVLLILSENAVTSTWVEEEVEKAMDKERQLRVQGHKQTVLFPVKLDDTIMQTTKAWAADVRRLWHIGDFIGWHDNACYQRTFTRLLRDLKSEASHSHS